MTMPGESRLPHAGAPVTVRPDGWPRPSGYADGIIVGAGFTVHVSGQIGWNPVSGAFETDDFGEQAVQAMRNVAQVLRKAGASPSQVARLTWYITSRDEYIAARRDIGVGYREVFGQHYPAMSVVIVSGLIEPRAKVEIEATAVIPE